MTKHLRTSVAAFAALSVVLVGCNTDEADTTDVETETVEDDTLEDDTVEDDADMDVEDDTEG